MLYIGYYLIKTLNSEPIVHVILNKKYIFIEQFMLTMN